jgi:protein-tyrosine phosphatase
MNILFVCTGNLNRSYAAHAIYQELKDGNVESAGTGKTAGGKLANKKMREALMRAGYAIPVRKSLKLTQELLDWADVAVCMADVHRQKIIEQFGLTSAAKCVIFMSDGSDVPDPHFSKDPADFDRVVKQIADNIKDLAC